MKTVKFAQVLKFSENLVKVDKPEEERYVTVLLYGRGVIEREIKEGKVPVAFTGYKAHAGQLIISTINARNGAAGIIPAELDGAVVSKDFPLFDIDHECVDEQYLLYYLWSDSFIHKAEQNSFGATMPRLHVKPFLNMQMRLPALSEQKRRAHTLCHVESLLNTQSHLLTKLDELVKSRFIEMFGDVIRNSKAWQMRVFEDVAASRLGKMLDAKQQTGKYSYPYLANFNVQWFRFNIENLNQMDFDEDDRAEFELKDGDLLVCEGGEIGRCAVWHNEIQPCFFQKALHRVRCNRQIIHPDYLAWWFKYNCDYDGFTAIAGSKATIAHLPGIKLKQLQVAVPPIELQEQFATFVEQTDKSKLAVKQSLEKLETLKKSLMQQYFG